MGEIKTTERKPGESGKAYEARCLYLRMGPGRSIKRVAEELGKSEGLVERWSSRWDWVANARDHDSYIQAEVAKTAVADRVATERAEAEKWLRRIYEHSDMLYRPFMIASDDLVRAEAASAKEGKPVPFRRKESMVKNIIRTAPFAAQAIELACARFPGLGRSGGGSGPFAPDGRTLAVLRAMAEFSIGQDQQDSDLSPGRRLAVLKAYVDYNGDPEPTG